MSRQGRNERCACGSGRKVKRCCGQQRGPAPEDRARAFLHAQAQLAASALATLDSEHDNVDDLIADLMLLPSTYDELRCRLPRLEPPTLERARRALRAGDHAVAGAALASVIADFEAPTERERLARTVLDLEEAGEICEHIAAVAYVDLSQDSGSLLVRASLAAALLVDGGLQETAGGLVIAS
jgi:hypothetical protein